MRQGNGGLDVVFERDLNTINFISGLFTKGFTSGSAVLGVRMDLRMVLICLQSGAVRCVDKS